MSKKLREIRSYRFDLQEEINRINSLVEEYTEYTLTLKKRLVMLEILEQEELKRKLKENKKKILR